MLTLSLVTLFVGGMLLGAAYQNDNHRWFLIATGAVALVLGAQLYVVSGGV